MKTCVLQIGLLLVGFASAQAQAVGYDKPLRVTKLDLGRAPHVPERAGHIEMTCFYYSHYVIKQVYYPWYKGAYSISVVPRHIRQEVPCRRRRSKGELRFPYAGGFGGARGRLVLLEDADGEGAAYGFTIYDSQTVAKVWRDYVRTEKEFAFTFGHEAGQTTLQYQRMVIGKCSLVKDGNTCWQTFRKQPGLERAEMPKCMDYEPSDPGDPSIVGYPVKINFSPRPVIRGLGPPIGCWAAQ